MSKVRRINKKPNIDAAKRASTAFRKEQIEYEERLKQEQERVRKEQIKYEERLKQEQERVRKEKERIQKIENYNSYINTIIDYVGTGCKNVFFYRIMGEFHQEEKIPNTITTKSRKEIYDAIVNYLIETRNFYKRKRETARGLLEIKSINYQWYADNIPSYLGRLGVFFREIYHYGGHSFNDVKMNIKNFLIRQFYFLEGEVEHKKFNDKIEDNSRYEFEIERSFFQNLLDDPKFFEKMDRETARKQREQEQER